MRPSSTRCSSPGRAAARPATARRLPPAPASASAAPGLRLARVADGELDVAFAGGSSHDWDLAAADLLVHEAGGALTTLAGHVLTYNRSELVHGALVAAGRERHAALIRLVGDRASELA